MTKNSITRFTRTCLFHVLGISRFLYAILRDSGGFSAISLLLWTTWLSLSSRFYLSAAFEAMAQVASQEMWVSGLFFVSALRLFFYTADYSAAQFSPRLLHYGSISASFLMSLAWLLIGVQFARVNWLSTAVPILGMFSVAAALDYARVSGVEATASTWADKFNTHLIPEAG